MSLSHLPPSERLATLKRCAQAQGQPPAPWWYCSPEDLLWVIEEREAALARVTELETANSALTSELEMAYANLVELEFERNENPHWGRRIEEGP